MRIYLLLRQCVCGLTEIERWRDTEVVHAGAPARRFTGVCGNCGRSRQFTVALPPGATRLAEPYDFGDGPSHVIDPGEWWSVAEIYAAHTQEHLTSPAFGSDAEIEIVFLALAFRLGAIDEIIKFLPDGEEAVPEPAFWTVDGRIVYELLPDRFTRSTLLAQREDARVQLERFVEQYGDDDDEADSDFEP